jgi:hypothetical protein
MRAYKGTLKVSGGSWIRWSPIYVSPLYWGNSIWDPRGWCGVAVGAFGRCAYVHVSP